MSRPVVVLDSNTIMYHLNKELDLTAFLTAYPDCEKHISIVTVLSKDSDLVRYEWPGFRSQEVV
ncbi:MAG: hypothetical protein LBT14_02825 [Treponema sp.]|jgi:hypothetical protein|nr:hypothetical protein [Treponema sp.]